MKIIKKIRLKDVEFLSNEEMRHLFGGSSTPTTNSDDCSASEEDCDTSKSCLVGGGPESGHCAYSSDGRGCHCDSSVSTGSSTDSTIDSTTPSGTSIW